MNLSVEKIKVDGGTQTRDSLNLVTVAEYAEAMEDGAVFPPIVVFHDGAEHWLADGFHRVEAAKRLQFLSIDATIKQGTRRDAILFSVSANASHGLRRTNADKRRAVETLLRDEEWQAWSDSAIAQRCAVSHPFVGKLREELASTCNGYKSNERRGADGRVTNTAKIGTAARPAPEPEAPPEDELLTQFVEAVANGDEQQAAELLGPDEDDFEEIEQEMTRPPLTTVRGGTAILDQREAAVQKREARDEARTKPHQKIDRIWEALETLAQPPLSAADFCRYAQDGQVDSYVTEARQFIPQVRTFLTDLERSAGQ